MISPIQEWKLDLDVNYYVGVSMQANYLGTGETTVGRGEETRWSVSWPSTVCLQYAHRRITNAYVAAHATLYPVSKVWLTDHLFPAGRRKPLSRLDWLSKEMFLRPLALLLVIGRRTNQYFPSIYSLFNSDRGLTSTYTKGAFALSFDGLDCRRVVSQLLQLPAFTIISARPSLYWDNCLSGPRTYPRHPST